jgi:ABC-2 type transport system permease protein
MDATETEPTKSYSWWLPYLAVLQTDLKQTIRSWVFRLWALVCLVSMGGYLAYRYGLHQDAGLIQLASEHTTKLLKSLLLGSIAMIVILTVSSIAGERGTLADSVLSRGISRIQYFIAKWHARSMVIIFTFATIACAMLIGSHYLLSEDIDWQGGLMGIVLLSALLWVIISVGVTVSALTSNMVLGITVLWIFLYGIGFLMTLLPDGYPSPQRLLVRLPNMLKGEYDSEWLLDVLWISAAVSCSSALVGIVGFSRRDV